MSEWELSPLNWVHSLPWAMSGRDGTGGILSPLRSVLPGLDMGLARRPVEEVPLRVLKTEGVDPALLRLAEEDE